MKRRITKHKRSILDTFASSHLLSAKELEELIPDADQSTIYRNLKRMEEDSVLRRVQIDEVTKYELVDKHGDHDHFICNRCEAVEVIYLEEDVIGKQLPTSQNFSVTVSGVCNECEK